MFLPVLVSSLSALSGTGAPLSLRAMAKVCTSSSITFDRPPWLPFAAALRRPSRVFSRMWLRSIRAAAGTAKNIEPVPSGS
ncbi:hypothetical protein [Kitasatospora sp. NPDC057198]|uniref:hypothetical protein n=1 Tax=Kitasatospora sp. NPDC057198 TaxID=3346046 RepID=UPI003638D7C1